MALKDNYRDLINRFEEIHTLIELSMLIGWDFQTYMPSKGVDQRSRQRSLMSALIHEKATDPKIGQLLKSIKEDPDFHNLTESESRNIYLIEREYNRNIRIPKELVEQIARQSTLSVKAWKQAKAEKNYSIFEPELAKMLELVKKRASYIDPEKEPIDVLLDINEPTMTSEIITQLFDQLKKGLIPILQRCLNSKTQPNLSLIKRKCPLPIQEELSQDIAGVVLYDLERGRIDTTEHPFTTGYYDDVRITTKYEEEDFSESFFAVMHECGHALYQQNLPRDVMNQPVGKFCSGGMHESQSRFIENVIGRSREFWEYYFSRFKEKTGDIFSDIELDPFILAINNVEQSKIRVLADEVTYSLHVIIRFEIERDLLTGKITTKELPNVWNAKYKEYLGIDILDDAEGVMQDIHWASGGFGSFCSYALGNLYNAQFFHAMRKEFPNFYDLVRTGDLKPIINWLTEKVHKTANLYDPPELIKRITGEDLNPQYFLQYLEEKYSKLYQ